MSHPNSTPLPRRALVFISPPLSFTPWHQTCNTTKLQSRLSESFLLFTYSRFSKPQLQATYLPYFNNIHHRELCLDILLSNMVALSSTDHLSPTVHLHLSKVMDILPNNSLCTSKLHHRNKLLLRRTADVSMDGKQLNFTFRFTFPD
ncbi:hypothetical protein DL98DRAFT_281525 [Cadophora sp. DSE1049]|nr:hypothetical protein DL98DRAFT_281525 [Cadophora sp. DSE1049]